MKDRTVEIELTDEQFLKIAYMAHELNITFNHMVERILTDYIINETKKLKKKKK